MINKEILTELTNSKNLLAFSAGGDSTALFFLLQEAGVDFDIAIVDYGLREQSKQEVAYAKELAQKYDKICYIHTAKKIEQNFEANARAARYEFFENLIAQHNYDTLLTAHHLGDRLEWFLMQLSKGAGCIELVGMQTKEQKNNYLLLRPLLHAQKQQLINYLQQRNIVYFHDETNGDEKYKRNYFRANFSEKLLQHYAEGIARSFAYLEEDKALLYHTADINTIGDFSFFTSINPRSDMVTVDNYFKEKKLLCSKNEKENLKQRKNTIISRKYLVVFLCGYVYIAPFTQSSEKMDKKFKEECRKLGIEPKLRPFLYKNTELLQLIRQHCGYSV